MSKQLTVNGRPHWGFRAYCGLLLILCVGGFIIGYLGHYDITFGPFKDGFLMEYGGAAAFIVGFFLLLFATAKKMG